MHTLVSSRRLLSLPGIVFSVLFLAGISLADQPLSDRSGLELTAFYRDAGNRIQVLLGGYILTLACIVLLLFLTHLRNIMRSRENEEHYLSQGAFGAGIVFLALLLAGAAASVAIPAGFYFDETRQTSLPDPGVTLYLPALGYTLIFLMGMIFAAVMIATTTLASFRFGLFPAWFNWLSIACALALLLSAPFSIFSFALLIWLVGASLLLSGISTEQEARGDSGPSVPYTPEPAP